ncbi:MAG: homoserine dehydrogenase, partial [Bacillota bacterium]|nr:homoserine dehydrogenase [Bacillota bacterium]
KNKKHVVTANKALISTYGDELLALAEEMGVMLYFEGSVAGGIPIIHGLNESLTANKIEEIVGIINGTTNYILTKMTLEGMEFEEALKEAQDKGYAEADPTSDVEAYDAVYKLTVLSSIAFGTEVDVKKVYREGITKISKADIEYAKELGYCIKLLAIGKDNDGVLELRVHPTLIPYRHPLANVNDAYNAIFIKGNAVGDLMLYGKGAGDMPTGSAVVSDIISILRYNINSTNKVSLRSNYWDKEVASMEKTVSEYYIRVAVRDVPGVLGDLTTVFGNNGVSLYSVIQKGKTGDDVVSVVFVTHNTQEGSVNKAIAEIKKLSSVKDVESIIRVKSK